MARPRMSDAEREAKRKARNRFAASDAAYKHYDTSTGFGSSAEWIRIIEEITGFNGGNLNIGAAAGNKAKINPDLVWFDLTDMPEDFSTLKSAFRKAMFKYHPDHGGTTKQAQDAMAAFQRLSKFY